MRANAVKTRDMLLWPSLGDGDSGAWSAMKTTSHHPCVGKLAEDASSLNNISYLETFYSTDPEKHDPNVLDSVDVKLPLAGLYALCILRRVEALLQTQRSALLLFPKNVKLPIVLSV